MVSGLCRDRRSAGIRTSTARYQFIRFNGDSQGPQRLVAQRVPVTSAGQRAVRLGRRYEIDEVVRAAAAAYADATLGSLDAIHLATGHAVFSTKLTAFVTYDERLHAAAAAIGLPAAAPGR